MENEQVEKLKKQKLMRATRKRMSEQAKEHAKWIKYQLLDCNCNTKPHLYFFSFYPIHLCFSDP